MEQMAAWIKLRLMHFWLVMVTWASSQSWGGHLLDTSYLTNQNTCRNTSDCPIGENFSCMYIYEGCNYGTCVCDPELSIMDNNGHCIALNLADSPCSTHNRCTPPFICMGGVCRCQQGFHPTNDRKHCLNDGARLVGQTCNPAKHKCYRKSVSGYTMDEVFCSSYSGTCVCREGYRTHNEQCLKRRVGDHGCTMAHDCGGGALCDDNYCVCPTGYRADSDKYKCLRIGAKVNMEIGERCDEVNELSYCSSGLVCHKCARERHEKCIRFLFSEQYGVSRAPTFQLTTTRMTMMMTSLVDMMVKMMAITTLMNVTIMPIRLRTTF